MSRCTGHCCKSFWLPLSPMEFKFQAKLAAIGKSRWNREELLKVADMVIFQRPAEKGRGYRYTCKHFDAASGNCMNYENRPSMCSRYPYGGKCAYKGCTMENRGAPEDVKPIEEKKCESPT